MPGDRECVSDTSYRICNANGQWYAASLCGSNQWCSGGYCVSVMPNNLCNPGARECTGSTTYKQCGSDGRWSHNTACSNGKTCSNGNCVGGSAPSRACTPGAHECLSRTTYRQCSAAGTWYVATSCANNDACSDGYCVSAAVCSTGAIECVSSNIYHECIGGAWAANEMCAGDETCISGQCVQVPSRECNDGETRCQPDSTTIVQYCSQQGQWQSDACSNGASCVDGACVAPECEIGKNKCNGNVLMDCENGKWAAYSDCSAINATCTLLNGNPFCKEAPAPEPPPKPAPASDNTPLLIALGAAVICIGAVAYFATKKKN